MSTTHLLRTTAATLLAVVLGLCSSSKLGAQSQTPLPTAAEIEAKWKERQERTSSFRVSWETKRTIPKGLFDSILDAAGVKAPRGSAPPRDTITDESGLLLISGKRFRLELESSDWSTKEGAMRPSSGVHVSDGKTYAYYIRRSSMRDYGTAHKHNANDNAGTHALGPLFLSPILISLRGCDPFYSNMSAHDYEIARRLKLGTRECVELVRKNRTQNRQEVMLLDISHDYIPVRLMGMSDSVVTSQVDIQDQYVDGVGWVPQTWTSVVKSADKRLAESQHVHKTRWELTAAPSDDAFDLQLSPDDRLVVHSKTEERHSVMRPDGSAGAEVRVSGNERTPRYEQLAAANQESTLSPWWIAIGVCAVATAVLLIRYFWVHTRAKPQDPIAP